jgi:hypothetical protein
MSIDHCYTQIDGRWVRTNMRIVNGEWEYIPDEERPEFHTDFYVDICHGGNNLTDERYYLNDLSSALEFYREGWRERQYVDDDGNEVGLDHIGLYSKGRLIHGLSIDLDVPGHEGESLRKTCEMLIKYLREKKL